VTITAHEPNWIEVGRTDVAVFAREAFGIHLHSAQIATAQAIVDRIATYYELHWANRSGKTTLVQMLHAHAMWYRLGVPPATDETDYRERWLKTEYASLHLAPLNELAGRMHEAFIEILNGTSPAQLDRDTGLFRPAPLAGMFAATRERSETGADHLFLRCLNGARTDIRSTEGKARRLESGAWRFIVWDEWSQTENPLDIRHILYNRLTARAADYEAPILLTGTSNEDVEHIAKEFTEKAEDPENPDWWGISAPRSLNPNASQRMMDVAERNLDPEDYARTVMGEYGGVKGRVFPSFLINPVFRNDLPRFTPPLKGDGWRNEGSEFTYLHVWDIALAVADNVGGVFRLPADFDFGWKENPDLGRYLVPIEGVSHKIIAGSRTLTTEEITHTIEETFLPYGGQIVLDTTDAHGKSIYRTLRLAGYPVLAFTFNERVGTRNIIRKERARETTKLLLEEGMNLLRGSTGEPEHDVDGVPRFDRDTPFGVIRLPGTWTKFKDQLSILKEDDQRQQKDAAMVVLMLSDVAYQARRAKHSRQTPQKLAVFGGGRSLIGVR
jgi:hypothetical protein